MENHRMQHGRSEATARFTQYVQTASPNTQVKKPWLKLWPKW